MKCQNCNSEYEGEFCPNCSEDLKQKKNNKKGKLLGFRTNKIWKKILSVGYLIFSFIYLLAVLCTEKYVNITNYDFAISQICDLLIFVIMITPYIFLSDTKFRNKMPLFKKRTIITSTFGLIIITVIIGVISGIIDNAHSPEFKKDRENHAYVETTTEATCEKDGEIKKFCDYCGISETKTISALGHKFKEISRKEPTCEKSGEIEKVCERCEKTINETLSPLGHKMKEISRKEATKTAEGEIVKECSVCGKTEKTVLEKIKDSSKKEDAVKKEDKDKDTSSVNNTSKAESSKVNSQKNNSSKTENATIDLVEYMGKSLQNMTEKLKFNFVEISDNNYFYSNKNNSVIIEIYTEKAGGISAIKLIEGGNKYTLLDIKSSTSVKNADKILNNKNFKSIGDDKWISKSKKDICMYVGGNWVYEKDSPLVSDEALRTKALESFEPKYSDSLYQSYLGNGQIVELLSDSFSKFAHDFSELTTYQQSEYINKINGRYVQLHGTVRSVDSNGVISVYCDDYGKQANLFFAGNATGKVKLITQQANLLSTLNEDDEVIIFAKINGDTYDSFLGTEFFDLFDGILYSIGNQKIDIPIIDSSIDGIYRYIPTDYSLGHGFGEY